MKVIVHDEASAEINQAAEWFESQQSSLGTEFLQAIRKTMDSVVFSPESFSRYEFFTARRWPNLRRAIVQRFLFVIVFDVRPDEIVVFAVYHSRRLPTYWI